MVVEAQTDGRARAAESVPASFTGAEPAISFNPHYLLDGLAAAAVSASPGRPPAGGGDASSAEPVPGRIRLEFTSPAKPALITWAAYDTVAAGEGAPDGAPPEADAAGGEAVTGDDGGSDGAGDAAPAFRYLVVPLRAAAGPGAGRA